VVKAANRTLDDLDSILAWKGKSMKRTALLLVCLIVGLIHPGSISSNPVHQVSDWRERAGNITYVSADHWAIQDRGLPEDDAVPEPGIMLLFGAGLIALTFQLKFRTFNRR